MVIDTLAFGTEEVLIIRKLLTYTQSRLRWENFCGYLPDSPIRKPSIMEGICRCDFQEIPQSCPPLGLA